MPDRDRKYSCCRIQAYPELVIKQIGGCIGGADAIAFSSMDTSKLTPMFWIRLDGRTADAVKALDSAVAVVHLSFLRRITIFLFFFLLVPVFSLSQCRISRQSGRLFKSQRLRFWLNLDRIIPWPVFVFRLHLTVFYLLLVCLTTVWENTAKIG